MEMEMGKACGCGYGLTAAAAGPTQQQRGGDPEARQFMKSRQQPPTFDWRGAAGAAGAASTLASGLEISCWIVEKKQACLETSDLHGEPANTQHLASSIQHPASSIQPPASGLQHPAWWWRWTWHGPWPVFRTVGAGERGPVGDSAR
ncbi:hypothetical protein N431DRAFT_529942 [Stipitochalara longipes BDJ]|nr:hypothetical protein N431DRAFT_529942 [Stipitochalara longipes BDJ]